MWSLLISWVLVSTGSSLAQETLTAQCMKSKPKIQRQETDKIYSLKVNKEDVYIYLKQENAFMIHNPIIEYVTIIDGDTGVTVDIHTPSGVGTGINMDTLAAFLYEGNQTFDLSNWNYATVSKLYKYAKDNLINVIDKNTDPNKPPNFNLRLLYPEIKKSNNVNDFEILKNSDKSKQLIHKYYQYLVDDLHKLYNTANYTPEMDLFPYMTVHTNYTRLTDKTAQNIANVARFLSKRDNYKHLKAIMPYFIKATKSREICVKSTKFLWALRGATDTYGDMNESLKAFENDKIVETHNAAITRLSETDKSYYLTYFMKDGEWILDINANNQYYAEYVYNHKVKHSIIWDSSVPLALNFIKGTNFGFFNYQTGSGLVINGKTNRGVFVRAPDNKMVDAFKANKIPEGFKIMSKIIEDTNVNNNDFDVNQLVQNIHDKQDISKIITNENDRNQFGKDFALLIDKLSEIGYNKDFKAMNLISVVLMNQNIEFSKEFVELASNMFRLDLPTIDMMKIMYASVLRSSDKSWKKCFFKNMNNLVKEEGKTNTGMRLYNKIRERIITNWKINILSETKYLADGFSGDKRN